jgi:hypothetical protein
MPAARPAPRALPWWAAACFFVSGAAGLLYEVVWSKQLSYLLGSSLHAVATVVAAFLGGLALGARLLGVRLTRRRAGCWPSRPSIRPTAWPATTPPRSPRCAR